MHVTYRHVPLDFLQHVIDLLRRTLYSQAHPIVDQLGEEADLLTPVTDAFEFGADFHFHVGRNPYVSCQQRTLHGGERERESQGNIMLQMLQMQKKQEQSTFRVHENTNESI